MFYARNETPLRNLPDLQGLKSPTDDLQHVILQALQDGVFQEVLVQTLKLRVGNKSRNVARQQSEKREEAAGSPATPARMQRGSSGAPEPRVAVTAAGASG